MYERRQGSICRGSAALQRHARGVESTKYQRWWRSPRSVDGSYNILTRRLVFGHIADCTSSYHAEALAILHALADNNFTHVTIYTDSQSVMDTLQRLHRHVNTNFSRLEQTDVWLAIWTLLATSTPPPLPPQGHRPPRHRPPSDHLPELWESVPRGISLLQALYKVLANLILGRLVGQPLLRSQTGFAPGRSTIHGIRAAQAFIDACRTSINTTAT